MLQTHVRQFSSKGISFPVTLSAPVFSDSYFRRLAFPWYLFIIVTRILTQTSKSIVIVVSPLCLP